MKTAIGHIAYCLLSGMMMISCSASDDMADQVIETTQPQARQVDLLISLGSSAQNTRQALTRNSAATASFLGMDLLVCIPYRTNGASVTASDNPLINITGVNDGDLAKEYDEVEKYNTYYMDRCQLMTGTDRMLVYGKAKPVSDDPKENGQLSPLPTLRKKTADIQFSLTSIRESTEAPADALALASYMTNIANTPGWSTTNDPELKSYYRKFTRAGAEGAGLMSGAAANIKAFVAALKTLLTGRIDDVSTGIIAEIDGTDISGNTYPRSLGLPDGAAVIRWMGDHFEPRTTTTTLDNINGINRYTYPAELMFFADSPIRTSTKEVSKTVYLTNDKLWSAFLDTWYTGPAAVSISTVAVAVENPIQYGVAKLDLTLSGMSATLLDAKNEEVTDADMAHLPLKGVIIGGQHTVGFNMKPQGEQTDVDGRFIYETDIIDGNRINTLVLQSYDSEKVPVILEFANNTGHEFTGKDGTVYPGTHFYLIAMTNPAGKGSGAYAGRVFTQDYTTRMTMSVTSLAKAYTCMPDLLAPRLEIGVQVVTKWIQATTTNVELL